MLLLACLFNSKPKHRIIRFNNGNFAIQRRTWLGNWRTFSPSGRIKEFVNEGDAVYYVEKKLKGRQEPEVVRYL